MFYAWKNFIGDSKNDQRLEIMKKVLPVITLYQPWATWIMREWKTIETRTHDRFSCLVNRTILIHAGQRTDDSHAAIRNPYLTKAQIMYNPDEVVNGVILGSVHVYDFRALSDNDSKAALIDCGTVQRYGLFLNNIQKFENPIPVKGEMGIWYFDIEKKEKVKKAKSQTGVLFNP
jgi:hypothetical protein